VVRVSNAKIRSVSWRPGHDELLASDFGGRVYAINLSSLERPNIKEISELFGIISPVWTEGGTLVVGAQIIGSKIVTWSEEGKLREFPLQVGALGSQTLDGSFMKIAPRPGHSQVLLTTGLATDNTLLLVDFTTGISTVRRELYLNLREERAEFFRSRALLELAI